MNSTYIICKNSIPLPALVYVLKSYFDMVDYWEGAKLLRITATAFRDRVEKGKLPKPLFHCQAGKDQGSVALWSKEELIGGNAYPITKETVRRVEEKLRSVSFHDKLRKRLEDTTESVIFETINEMMSSPVER